MRTIEWIKFCAMTCMLLQWHAAPAQTNTPPRKPVATPVPRVVVAKPVEKPSGTSIKDEKTGFTYALQPTPNWVVPAAENPQAAVDRAPMHYRVIDEQIRIDGNKVSNYSHVVRVVNDSAGLSNASQIELEFEPTYQSVALHHLRVIRDGKPIDKLDTKRIQLLQRETQLERKMYDGRVTLSVVLDDVRTGDQIDYAYTIEGSNPVFAGKFSQMAWLGSWYGPVQIRQVRLLAPADRPIQYQVGPKDAKVETNMLGTLRETIFRNESVRQVSLEDAAPYSALKVHQVQFSEYTDWTGVAQWGEKLFQSNATSKLVDEKALEIKAKANDKTEQLLLALDFVQKDIRYFGTEIGINSHMPAAPEKVMEQRFGDCKDKVGLLIALLKRLEIDAKPVLVSTYLRRQTQFAMPGPTGFDHVIARVDLDGTSYWLDATRNQQSGSLAQRQSVGLGYGLSLAAGTSALEELPLPYDTVRMVVSDSIQIDQFSQNPKMISRVTYHSDLAEIYKEALATRGLQNIAPELSAPYVKIYPKINSLSPVKVEQGDGAISFIQEFSLPEFWRFPEQRALVGDMAFWAAGQSLAILKAETRRDPVNLSFPGIYRHNISVDFAEDIYRQPGSRKYAEAEAEAGISIKTSAESGLRRVEYKAEVRLGTDQIEANNWRAYTAKLSKISPKLYETVVVSSVPLDRLTKLTADIKQQEDSIKAKRVKPVTRIQSEALFKIISLTAQINSGRLSPALEAQARNERGVQYDHLGRAKEGREDYERALVLAPDNLDYQRAAAVNALQLRDFDKAIELSNRVIARNPDDAEAMDQRARARYFKTELAAAQTDWTQLLKDRAAVRRGYPIVWLSLALRQQNMDASNLEKNYPSDQLPTDWPRPLVDFALGKLSVDAVIQAAKAEKGSAEALCEAYFYIGEKFRAEGDASRATDYWRKSVDQGILEFVEDAASRFRLDLAASK